MNQKIGDRIDQAITKRRVLRILTVVDDEEDYFIGIPVKRSRSLVAIHRLIDFHFDGYTCIRLKDVTDVRRSRSEVTQERILRSTGEIQNFDNPPWLRIGSIKSLLLCLKERKICACVSSALFDVDVFAVGTVDALREGSVVLKSFDAHGDWIVPKHEIKYSDITEVTFEDEYSTVFHQFIASENLRKKGS